MKLLQAKYDAIDRQNIKPREEDLKFECQICMSQIEDDKDVFPLLNCEHIYHESCMKSYMKSEVEQTKCPLLCCDPKCKKELSCKDLKKLLSNKDFDSFTNYSFLQAVSK